MILQNSKHKSISLKDEHDWLKTYLELENLRMENTLDFTITIDKNLIPTQIFVPTMVLQPYVENAVIHGLLPKELDKKLAIEIMVEGQNLKCIITDNGIGRAKSNELNKAKLKHHESTAMSLTKDRLAILNIETGNGVGPKVIDLFDENGNSLGTKVELILPLIIQHDV
jgi:sensor histidine kinase YesM